MALTHWHTEDTVMAEDPKQKHDRPPFNERSQVNPGSTSEMREKPDHG
jgi:hypothetical protein